ncbi:hypothetical protein, partial [Streptomyces sp. NPDC005507]|uniref:hypothetical protein n=1 Tax=Streptomyces sp. NPDC005507 TaxID=3154885 RepID=UPI0033B7C610
SIRSPLVSGSSIRGPVCAVLVPRPAARKRGVMASRLPASLFEVDYLTVEPSEICVGWSRHWVVVWLWFLS